MVDQITYEHFQDLVGDAVTLHAGDLKLDASIAEVTKMTPHGDSTRIPFSVLFITQQSTLLEQQIFTLDHSRLGRFDLFLVPLGPKAQGMCYEAVFT